MRTRSSRLFVILLHLIGAPNIYNVYNNNNASNMNRRNSDGNNGIVGVNPWPLVMETITSTSDSSFREYEPVWIQQSQTSQCLGPNARLTTCGDATQWWIVPVSNDAVAFCIATGREDIGSSDEVGSKNDDVDESKLDPHLHHFLYRWWYRRKYSRQKKQRESQMECLLHSTTSELPSTDATTDGRNYVTVGKAKSSHRAWQFKGQQLQAVISDKNEKHINSTLVCIHQRDGRSLELLPCQDDSKGKNRRDSTQIKFSLVRYKVTSVPPTVAKKSFTTLLQSNSVDDSATDDSDHDLGNVNAFTQPTDNTQDGTQSNLPSRSRDRAHRRANPEVENASASTSNSKLGVMGLNPMHHYYILNKNKKYNKVESLEYPTYATALQNTNPILLLNAGKSAPNLSSKNLLHASSSKDQVKNSLNKPTMTTATPLSHVHRIPVHPYIAAAKSGQWTDTQTGLSFPTDLCSYLGYNRPESGRHTLTGFGLFKKYVIKVYGIAFYVSKRDVLADPAFIPYAGLSAAELRKLPDFYKLLRTQGSEGTFERTLIVKTNMQLAAETISKSLEADWKMLTEEAKRLLTGTSLQARPADDKAIELVQSSDNPNKCSCSRVAPDEFQADPACCARGTELAFTWLKNGHLVIRLDGQIVDEFDRPDIAEGIFFEYLRLDDPMSTEFTDRVVEGFPFLLAPLAQVKGINMGQQQHHQKPVQSGSVGPLAFASNVMSWMSARAVDVSTNVQSAASVSIVQTRNAANGVADFSVQTWREFNQRRELLTTQATQVPAMIQRIFTRGVVNDTSAHTSTDGSIGSTVANETFDNRGQLLYGNTSKYPLFSWFGQMYYAPDEIGPMIVAPNMDATRKFFLTLVHFYLLLLFIVSFPGAYTTRTQFMVKKPYSGFRELSESESDDEFDEEEDRIGVLSPVRGLPNSKGGILRMENLVATPSSSDDNDGRTSRRHSLWRSNNGTKTPPSTPATKRKKLKSIN